MNEKVTINNLRNKLNLTKVRDIKGRKNLANIVREMRRLVPPNYICVNFKKS